MRASVLPLTVACLSIAGCAALSGDDTSAGPMRAVSDTAIVGFAFPESVGCDPGERVLYVSQFGGTELKPAEKDGNGYISKLNLEGKVIEQRAFQGPGGFCVMGDTVYVPDLPGSALRIIRLGR